MTEQARREYLEALAEQALERYRRERRDPDAELEIDERHLSTAAAVAECLVIGLSDPGEYGQTLHAAIADAVSVGFQAIANELVAARRRVKAAEERSARSRRDTEP